MIEAAIVGLGRWGRRLVDAVQDNGAPKGARLRFTRAAVRTAAKAADFTAAQRLKVGSFEDALADDSVRAIVLATPHELHAGQIAAAAKAKKHVFVEKPLAFSLQDAEAAMAAVRAHRLVLAVGYNRRYLPAVADLKRAIAEKALGMLVHLEGNFSNPSGLKYGQGMWRAAEGGAKGAMTAMGIHVLDAFINLGGPIESVRATSVRRAMPVAVDDAVSVNVRFRSGASGYLSTLLTTPRHWRLQVFGSAGWAHMRDEHLLERCGESGVPEQKTYETVDTVRLELEAFADAIDGRGAYAVTPAEALNGAAALEAILQSAAAGGEQVAVQPSSLDAR